MEELFRLGISDNELKCMLEQCPDIMDMSNEEVREKIEILNYIECNERHIRNIIVCNPYYLDRINDDILKLIGYLKEIGISNINLLFDSNPFFLNKDAFEIREFVNDRLSKGILLEDIVDEIESNPYVIDEF